MRKNIINTILSGVIGVIVLTSCGNDQTTFGYKNTSRVELREQNGQWSLYRNKKPYFIKGAHGSTHLDWLKQMGGNSFIAYEKELSDSLLNLADSLALTVSVVLDVGPVRFPKNNYRDPVFVMNQRNRIKQVVKKYYNHPAILFWIVGNELHLVKRKNRILWKEVNEISKMIHSIDPYHPTTTVIAAYPTKSYETVQLKLFTPDIDFLSVAMYDGARLRRESESYVWGINGPFLVTEWAGKPYWAYQRTEWDAIIEQNSTKNTAEFYHNYYLIFEQNKEKCMGGYVFFWGQKQERTHTVFSLILDDKYKTQIFEGLQDLWSGTNPDNWCPRIDTFFIEGYMPENHYMERESEYTAIIKSHDPDHDPLLIKWELRTEGYYRGKTGGEPERITDIISMSDTLLPYKENFSFKTPEKEGQYRLFVYVYDDHDYVATANIPLYVMP